MQIKNKLTIGSLEFKITDDKLYIETSTGSETYALRSINGISVKDDINTFDEELGKQKSARDGAYGFIIGGVFSFVCGMLMGVPIAGLLIGGLLFFIGYKGLLGLNAEPKMRSIVRITMNSGDKSFSFFKDDANSGEVADFVATLEDTLTAFHK